jgi:hypothetical protein
MGHEIAKQVLRTGCFNCTRAAKKGDVEALFTIPGFDKANVSDTVVNALIKRVWKCLTIQIIPAIISGLGIIVGFGK